MGFKAAMVIAIAGAGLVSACSADRESIARLERALGSDPSATRALEHWCAARGLAANPVVTARVLAEAPPPEPDGLRQRLAAGPEAVLGYRHVELVCGGRVLSVAHNWYRRDHLSAAMNAVLDGSDAPFGKVVAPLRFTRETIDSRHGGEPGCPHGTVLSQVALLRLPDGAPLALVTECYTRAAIQR
ncbi:MAG: hypothetical protein KGM49_04475 [Sphingomonadales bacterium]|nr:hypothetical protein [Sphingomonadales bacterium]